MKKIESVEFKYIMRDYKLNKIVGVDINGDFYQYALLGDLQQNYKSKLKISNIKNVIDFLNDNKEYQDHINESSFEEALFELQQPIN